MELKEKALFVCGLYNWKIPTDIHYHNNDRISHNPYSSGYPDSLETLLIRLLNLKLFEMINWVFAWQKLWHQRNSSWISIVFVSSEICIHCTVQYFLCFPQQRWQTSGPRTRSFSWDKHPYSTLAYCLAQTSFLEIILQWAASWSVLRWNLFSISVPQSSSVYLV